MLFDPCRRPRDTFAGAHLSNGGSAPLSLRPTAHFRQVADDSVNVETVAWWLQSRHPFSSMRTSPARCDRSACAEWLRNTFPGLVFAFDVKYDRPMRGTRWVGVVDCVGYSCTEPDSPEMAIVICPGTAAGAPSPFCALRALATALLCDAKRAFVFSETPTEYTAYEFNVDPDVRFAAKQVIVDFFVRRRDFPAGASSGVFATNFSRIDNVDRSCRPTCRPTCHRLS